MLFEEPDPRWLRVSVYLFSISAAACSIYIYVRDRMEAARRCAVLDLQVNGMWSDGLVGQPERNTIYVSLELRGSNWVGGLPGLHGEWNSRSTLSQPGV